MWQFISRLLVGIKNITVKVVVRRTKILKCYKKVKSWMTFFKLVKNKKLKKAAIHLILTKTELGRKYGRYKDRGLKKTLIKWIINRNNSVAKTYYWYKTLFVKKNKQRPRTKSKWNIELEKILTVDTKEKSKFVRFGFFNDKIYMRQILRPYSKNNNVDTLKLLERIDRLQTTPPYNRRIKKAKEELNKKTLVFNVYSPQTHNFSRGLHEYTLANKNYNIPIRSGYSPKRYVKRYTYYNIPLWYVKVAMLGADFGQSVFNLMRLDGLGKK